MIKKYKITCKCGLKKILKYGKSDDNKINEIFACQKCKSFFSLDIGKEDKCSKCGSEKLISYNPNKESNLEYYNKMYKQKMLPKTKLKELQNFWKNIEDKKCPSCGKKNLVWEICK